MKTDSCLNFPSNFQLYEYCRNMGMNRKLTSDMKFKESIQEEPSPKLNGAVCNIYWKVDGCGTKFLLNYNSVAPVRLLTPFWWKECLVWFLHDPGMLLSALVATVEGLFLYIIYSYKSVLYKLHTSSCPLKYNWLKYCLNLILGARWQRWVWICLLLWSEAVWSCWKESAPFTCCKRESGLALPL